MSHNHSTDVPALAQESIKTTVSTVADRKSGLRKDLLVTRRNLAADQRAQWDTEISRQLLHWAKTRQPRSIGVYAAIQSEPDLHAAYQELAALGIQLALPLVQGKAQPLLFAHWEPGMALVPGAMKVPVPAEIIPVALPEVLCIPCVGHNRAQFRLGYGGGFYDRTLAITPRPFTIGISYPALLTQFDADAHDVALDLILTGG